MKNRLFKIIWMDFKRNFVTILAIWVLFGIGSLLWFTKYADVQSDTFLSYYYYSWLICLFFILVTKLDEDLSAKKNALFSQYYYMLPISTWKFVTIEMLSSLSVIISILLGVMSLILIMIGISAFYIGPILFICSFFVLNEGLEYIIGRIKTLLVLFILLIDIPLFWWFGCRFGAPFIFKPTHKWNIFTLNEFLFLFSISAAGYILQIIGVEKDRRGEGWGNKAPSKALKNNKRSLPLKKYESPSQALFYINRKGGIAKKGFSGKVFYWTLPYKDTDMAFAIMKSSAIRISIISAILIVPVSLILLFLFKGMWEFWKNILPFLLPAFYLPFFAWMFHMWGRTFSMKSPIYLKTIHIFSSILIILGLIFLKHILIIYFFFLFMISIVSIIECYYRRFIRLSGIAFLCILWLLLFLLMNYLFLPLMNIDPYKSLQDLSFLIGLILFHLAPFAIIPLGVYYTRHQ